ncbi:MAG: hypothetical protein IPG04_20715 [Polyangiaceae bacterium]|nr:hypothetical protein [Polyangiaceae bacterium]
MRSRLRGAGARGSMSWAVFAAFVLAVVACRPGEEVKTPPGGAEVCSSDALSACEARLAEAVALGEGIGDVARSYAKARAGADASDPLAQAVDEARRAGAGSRGVLVLAGGAADPGVAPELPRVKVGALTTASNATRGELLAVAIAEAAELDYVAVLGPDGKVTRAFGADPLVIVMSGVAPAVVDADPKVLERDLEIEKRLRAAVERTGAFDYVAAAAEADALTALLDAEPPFDAQALRGRAVINTFGLAAQPSLVSAVTPPPRPDEPAMLPHETAYYDILRVRSDRAAANAFEQRKGRLLPAIPEELRPLFARAWGDTTSCVALAPPSFDRPRDLGYAYLMPQAIRPAGARTDLGRMELPEWYERYEKLVALVERTKSTPYAIFVLLMERGGASSIVPTGKDAHRRVDGLALKHAKALAALAKAKPGRIGFSQIGFVANPNAYGDDGLKRAMFDLARLAAQGSLSEATDAWDVLAATLTGLLVSGNMPLELRQEHLLALAEAFKGKLDGALKQQTGWGPALAYGADLAYRAIGGLGPDPKASIDQIARALETDPKIAQPGLAALTSAMARYAALAAEGSLGTPIVGDKDAVVPARAAARASLASALAKLADAGPPDARVLNELAALADNATATLAFAVSSSVEANEKKAKAAAPPGGPGKAEVCAATDDEPTDPRLVRALAKLRDQRKQVLGLKALRDGTDPWSKRARLVALLLSDAIDAASAYAPAKPPARPKTAKEKERFTPIQFLIPGPESDAILSGALTSLTEDKAVVSAVAAAYGLMRGLWQDGTQGFAKQGLPKARDLFAALAPLLTEPGQAVSAGGLLVGLAGAFGAEGEFVSGDSFVNAARTLYEKGSADEADMVLLGAVVFTAFTEAPLTPKAFELASAKSSKMAWVFDFLRYGRPGVSPPPGGLGASQFKPGLEALVSDRCATASASTASRVIDALEAFKRGERDKARAELDAALKDAEGKLVLPHVSFTFKQETTTRVLNLSIDVGLAAPFVAGTGGINVGAGFKSTGEPKLDLELAIDAPDSKRARDDSARYWVHASSTAAILHFLSGDTEKGELAAARALSAVLARSWLYAPGVSDEPIQFADASAASFALLAQQAIESGRPLLAGSLLQVIRTTFDPTTTRAEQISALLDDLPKPLRGIEGLAPLAARAKKTLTLAGGGMACVGPKSDKAFLLRPACEGYAQAVALRVADAVAAMPELSAKEKKGAAPGCKELAALDGFLVPAQKGNYAPEKLLDAVDAMLAEKKAFEAAFLLTRPRDPSHCTDRVVQQMRKTADLMQGVPSIAADLLTGIVNCRVGAEGPALTTDIIALDLELDRVGDPSRQIQIGLFSAALAARRAEPQILEAIVKQKDYLKRHREHGPLLPIALTLDHLASALGGKSIDVEGTQKDMDFLCGIGDLPAGPDTCKGLKLLRGATDPAERKRLAEDVIRRFSP